MWLIIMQFLARYVQTHVFILVCDGWKRRGRKGVQLPQSHQNKVNNPPFNQPARQVDAAQLCGNPY